MDDNAASAWSKSKREEARITLVLGGALALLGGALAASTLLRGQVRVPLLLTACVFLFMGAAWIVEGRGCGRSLWLWLLSLAAALARVLLFPM